MKQTIQATFDGAAANDEVSTGAPWKTFESRLICRGGKFEIKSSGRKEKCKFL